MDISEDRFVSFFFFFKKRVRETRADVKDGRRWCFFTASLWIVRSDRRGGAPEGSAAAELLISRRLDKIFKSFTSQQTDQSNFNAEVSFWGGAGREKKEKEHVRLSTVTQRFQVLSLGRSVEKLFST